VPEPAVGTVGRLLAAARLVAFSPEQLRLLDFGRVVDTTRLHTEFGFTPRWTTAQAFDDFVRGRALTPLVGRERVAAGVSLVERGVRAAAGLLSGGRP
jgi:UDP-glucose 4-epimerase